MIDFNKLKETVLHHFYGGDGVAVLDGEQERLSVGDCHYCKKGQSHMLINIGTEDLVFYAVVSQQ